jgi:hypothetical protein
MKCELRINTVHTNLVSFTHFSNTYLQMSAYDLALDINSFASSLIFWDDSDGYNSAGIRTNIKKRLPSSSNVINKLGTSKCAKMKFTTST